MTEDHESPEESERAQLATDTLNWMMRQGIPSADIPFTTARVAGRVIGTAAAVDRLTPDDVERIIHWVTESMRQEYLATVGLAATNEAADRTLAKHEGS